MSSEPNIRNRVAGAVVLVSLAVIFLPLILDGKKKNQILESYIPESPKSGEIILVNVDEASNADEQETDNNNDTSDSGSDNSITIAAEEITGESDNTENTSAPVIKSEPEKKPEEVVQAPKKLPERTNRPNYSQAGFLVQVGSFGSRKNALALVDTLKKSSHKAYFKTGLSAGKTRYRVFSGPYLQKNSAESAMKQMKQLAKVNPIVVTYDPVKHAQNQ